MQAEQALQLERHLWEALLDRSMDVSASVRARLFSLLSKVHPGAQLSLVLRQGLEDTTTAVRRECESMLQTFARSKNGAATTVALLSFVGQLLESSGDAVFNELSAEKALHCLLASADWCVVSEESIHSLLHSEELSAEQAVVGRVALALDAEVWSLDKTLCGTGLLRKTLQALDRGDEFMLRQLLLVLLYSEVRDSDRTLLHVATATLLRAPVNLQDTQATLAFPQDSVQRSCRSTFHLAVLLARHSLGLTSRVSKSKVSESRFTESMLTVVEVLQTKATSDFSEFKEEGINALAEYGHSQHSLAQQLAVQLQQIRSARSQFVAAKDFVSACKLQKEMEDLQEKYEAARSAAEKVFQGLEQHLSRILSVTDAILAHTQADLSEDYSLYLLMEDILHPALMIADSAPGNLGSWPSVRALAVKCIALHASLSQETSSHWNFFKSVLDRHIPEVTSRQRYDVGDPAASECIIFISVAFMVDSILQTQTSEEQEWKVMKIASAMQRAKSL